MTRLLFAALTAATLLLPAAPGRAAAQATVTTGAIRGRVVDAAGAPLVGATVTAVSEGTALTRASVVGTEGEYTIRLLPPGTYRVTARRIGSQPQEVGGVRVSLNQTTGLNFQLTAAAVQLQAQRITAEAPPVDVSQGGVQQNVSEEEINALPTLGRDFTDFINLSGLVAPVPETTTGGQFSVAGQRPSQTNIQIDGVDANNSFFGENRGGSRIPFNFSLESIREFQIITNGYDVEYGNYSGGIVNIVTRGGTNDFKGSLYANYQGDKLIRKDFAGVKPTDFSTTQYSARFEGPVLRDKLFYMLTLDGQRRREPFQAISPDYLRRDRPLLTSRDSTSFRQDTAAATALERFYQIADTSYGVSDPAGGFGRFTSSNDVITLFGRVDWNVNDRHRLTVRNNYSNYDNLNEALTFTGGRFRGENFRNNTNSLVGELTSVLATRLSNVLRVQYSTEERPRTGNFLRPELNVQITPSQTVSIGPAGSNGVSFRNSLIEDKVQIVDNATFAAGDHLLKFGTNNTFSHFDNVFWNFGQGTFTFRSLQDFELGRATSYTRTVTRDGSEPRQVFDAQEYSVYGQDDWQVTRKLLVTLGLRYDVTRVADAPVRVLDVERAFGFRTGNAPIDDNNISPRLSLAYDRKGDATEVLRAGVGLFYGRIPYVLAGNAAASGSPLFQLDCRGTDADDPDLVPSVLPQRDASGNIVPGTGYASLSETGSANPFTCGSGSGSAGFSGVPTYTFWTDDFAVPETFKANFGYERAFTRRTRASIDLIYSGSTRLYTVRDLNLRDPQFTLANEQGRYVFVPQVGYNPVNGVSAGPIRLRNTDFGNVFANYNDGVARSIAGTMEARHQFNRDNWVRASYTYTWAKDNSSYSCCTAFEGYSGDMVGIFGPNQRFGVGFDDGTWGPSSFLREHAVVLAGATRLPLGVDFTTFFRLSSGRPWTPAVRGDINGDGNAFNDRPFVFQPKDLPVFVSPSVTEPLVAAESIAVNRLRYAELLRDHDCVGDFVGRILPRNTCRQPWYNRVDVRLNKRLPTMRGQNAELTVDLFNILNGLKPEWGQYVGVRSDRLNLLEPQGSRTTTDESGARTTEVLYTVPATFAQRQILGFDLGLQFSAQIGLRYSF